MICFRCVFHPQSVRITQERLTPGTLRQSALIARHMVGARAHWLIRRPWKHISASCVQRQSHIGDRMAAGAPGASGMPRQALWSNQLAQGRPFHSAARRAVQCRAMGFQLRGGALLISRR
jgi:hypothetical protein